MLLKPEEIILYRSVLSGGLCLLNIKAKALTGLIRSFLETACMPKNKLSLYLHILFRYHVLGEDPFEDTGLPPFYNAAFFEIIRNVHKNLALNVATMTEKIVVSLLIGRTSFYETDRQSTTIEKM